jgi:hypothetical protein
MKIFRLLPIIFLLLANRLHGQQAKDHLGSWLMIGSDFRISEKWTLHSDVQLRSYYLIANPNQIVLRPGILYQVNKQAKIGAGYAFLLTLPFDPKMKSPSGHEHRVWQDLLLRNQIGRLEINHRYRIEERWVFANASTRFKFRARYFLQVNLPLNHFEMEPGTFFLYMADEIILRTQTDIFGQNRFFGALGFIFCSTISLRGGYLHHYLSGKSFHRLFLQATFKPDFRKMYKQ